MSGKAVAVRPDATWNLLSYLKNAYDLLRLPNGPFDRSADDYINQKVKAATVNGISSVDEIINQATGMEARIYRLETSPLLTEEIVVPVLVFFHGGSFVHSTFGTYFYDTLCRSLVRRCNAIVVSVDYRKAPEHKYPCAIDDSFHALQWVHRQSWVRSGKDSKAHVFLVGDSSGGNIVHHVSVKALEWDIPVMGNILVNPLFGGNKRTKSEKQLDGRYYVTMQARDWYWKEYLPVGADRDHIACNPFAHKAARLKGKKFPKSLVVVAGLDPGQDWQKDYAQILEKDKQDVKLLYLQEATVGFYLSPDNVHYDILMEKVKEFVSFNGQ